MRELVVKYMAEKVCHEEMVKMPLVDFKVLEYKERYRLRRPVSFGAYEDERVVGIIARAARIDDLFDQFQGLSYFSKMDLRSGCHQIRVHKDEIPNIAFKMRYGRHKFTAMPFWVDQCTNDFHGRNESGRARVAFEDEFGAAEEREVNCEAQQGRSRVKRKLFGSCRNNMGDVRTLIMEEVHTTKYYVHPGLARLYVDEAVARHGVHVLSIPDRDGMYIEVLERDVEVVRNTSRYEYCLSSID
nr:putative reverse transcriptase domain-containing protein [Tanacetum cinerariifolium]GFA48995.1 putative reverse transcriptase domain-containing protein [Tanacetum cinerariifolium]